MIRDTGILAALGLLENVTKDEMVALFRRRGWDKWAPIRETDSVRNMIGLALECYARERQPSLFEERGANS